MADDVRDRIEVLLEVLEERERERCARIAESWAGVAESAGRIAEQRRWLQAAAEMRRG